MRLEKTQHEAALLLQRYARGHLVSKHYIRQRGDIAIMATLQPFRDMKTEIGTQLSNLIRFLWRVYKRTKEKKKKKKKGKKGKGKKGKAKLDPSKTVALPSPTRSMSMPTPKPTPGKSSGVSPTKAGMKTDKLKVTAKDNEGSIDLTTGDNENSFTYSAQELMRRETHAPSHQMEGIAERENEEGAEDQDEGEGEEREEKPEDGGEDGEDGDANKDNDGEKEDNAGSASKPDVLNCGDSMQKSQV